MSAQPPLPLSELDHLFANLYGVQLAGIFVSCALYGVSCLQAFIYYMSKPKDPFLLKALPGWLIVIETLHQFLLCVAIYKIAINNFGNQNVLTILIPELFISTIFQGFLTFSAHLFYIYRIWKFSKKMYIFPILCIPLTTLQLGTTLANNSLVLKHQSPLFIAQIVWTTYVTHAVNVFLDFVFVVAMIWLLIQEKRSPFKKTNRLINRLVLLTINTGLATMTATLLTIIFLAASTTTLTYVFFNFLISPLYVNSVMANLNSREYIRGGTEPQGTGADFVDGFNNNNTSSGAASHELSGLKFTSNTQNTSGFVTQLDEPGSELTTGFSGSTKATAIV